MKTAVLFFCNVIFFISLKSMQEYLPIMPSKIGGYCIKNKNYNSVNLDSIPSNVIIVNMFPCLHDIDYNVDLLLYKYGNWNQEQQDKNNKIMNALKDFINLSMVNKQLYSKKPVRKIDTIKECFLVDNIPFISLYKYRNYKVFTDDPVTYFLNVMEQNWYSQICDLNRSQWHAKLNVHTLLKKNFRIEKELIKNFQLRIYLVKDRPKFLVFHRDELYEDFSLFCQKIGTKLYNKALRKDDCMISICQDLQKECENKKSLSTEKVSALLKLLYNDSLKGNHKKEFNECDAPLLHEIILFLKQATIYNPVNICFGFLFSKDIDCERPYFEIIKSLNNDLGNKNESRRNLDIDKEVFFSFIEKTFNDYSSKTDKIISACKILQLKQSDEIFKNSPLSNILNVDYYVNFEIQNNSNGMSDESIIPLDLLDY